MIRTEPLFDTTTSTATSTITFTVPESSFKITKVANGFIIEKHGQRYVFTTIKALLKDLEKELDE